MPNKNFVEKAIEEFPFRINDGVLEIWEIVLPDGDWEGKTATTQELKSFLQSKLEAQEVELADKLEKACGLELKDLPAFPPKGINLFDLILKIGIEKIKREQREEILGKIKGKCSVIDEIIEKL